MESFRTVVGLEHVLKNPHAFIGQMRRVFEGGEAIEAFVQQVASIASDAKEAGVDPMVIPGALASLVLEDLGAIQRRIKLLESISGSNAGAMQPYRHLMIRLLRARAHYLLQVH